MISRRDREHFAAVEALRAELATVRAELETLRAELSRVTSALAEAQKNLDVNGNEESTDERG